MTRIASVIFVLAACVLAVSQAGYLGTPLYGAYGYAPFGYGGIGYYGGYGVGPGLGYGLGYGVGYAPLGYGHGFYKK